MAPSRTIHLQVLTPTQVLVSADGVSMVHVRLADGAGIGILPGHAPLIAESVTGPLRYTDSSGSHTLSLVAGILQIEKDQVSILTRGQVEEDAAGPQPENETETRYGRLARALLTSQNHVVHDGQATDTRRDTT